MSTAGEQMEKILVFIPIILAGLLTMNCTGEDDETTLDGCESRVATLMLASNNTADSGTSQSDSSFTEDSLLEAIAVRGNTVCEATLVCLESTANNTSNTACWARYYKHVLTDCPADGAPAASPSAVACNWTDELSYACDCGVDGTVSTDNLNDCQGQAFALDADLAFCDEETAQKVHCCT
jgi:hypothetical protein